MRIEVTGTADFRQLAKKLRAAGSEGKGIRREMSKGLRKAAQPIVDQAKQNARDLNIVGHPVGKTGSRGGRGGASARAARAAASLGKRKAGDKARMRAHRNAGLRQSVGRTVSAKVQSGRAASLRVRSDGKRMPRGQQSLPGLMNRGQIKHPVFANRRVWARQTMAPGWFDRAGRSKGPAARDQAIGEVKTYLEGL